MIFDLKNKKVTIIGLKLSGMAAAELAAQHQGIVKISEGAPRDLFEQPLASWVLRSKVKMEFGGHTQKFIEDSNLVVISPGVRIDAECVRWAKNKKIPVIGEIELAWRFCRKPVVAVTGSNGKTTVSTLIARILEKAGKKVSLCGNIGSPFSRHVLEAGDKDFFVLEISSFQLESIAQFRPHTAVFLNFSENHLDRHKDIAEYFNAKKRIFMNQTKADFAVLNYENPMIRELAFKINAKVSYFNPPAQLPNGRFNPNQLAALEAGRVLGVDAKLGHMVFREFTGVEHRLEWVRNLGGIDFINDSKATTAEAGRWALMNADKPIVMICGGRDKNIDFSTLRNLVKQKIKKMAVIGEARIKLKKTFEDVIPVYECGGLEEAVFWARENAAQGDCVMFSPMCASFDMFANFEERGKIFKEIVGRL